MIFFIEKSNLGLWALIMLHPPPGPGTVRPSTVHLQRYYGGVTALGWTKGLAAAIRRLYCGGRGWDGGRRGGGMGGRRQRSLLKWRDTSHKPIPCNKLGEPGLPAQSPRIFCRGQAPTVNSELLEFLEIPGNSRKFPENFLSVGGG